MSVVRLFQLIAFTMLLFNLGCKPGADKQADKLGEINFVVTGKEAAKPHFNKGLLLLHSFEFDDAAEEFRKAIEIDRNFVMAYWGEAMTHNHPLWRYQAFDKAITVLNQLAPTPAARIEKAQTDIEKDFLTSLHILYGKGDKIARDSSYAAFLGDMHKKYPGNNEVAAFYSLALIGSVPVGRDDKIYEKAAAIAKKVLQSNPKHPGALHYLIHAYDDPAHAAFAVKAADTYSTVAPAAGHALHMPTHIYLALGMWDKVISSNIASWEAGKERKERKKLTNDALNYHAMHWLQYGYLQSGQKEKAQLMLDSMFGYGNSFTSNRSREYMIFQKATYLAETNDYSDKISTAEIKQDDLNIVTRAMDHFVNGMKFYNQGNAQALGVVITKLTGEILVDEERVSNTAVKGCGSINSPLPNTLDIQQSQVMLLQLKASMAWLKKDTLLTEKLFKKAVDLEAGTSYAYGPPTVVKPSPEIYAEWLLEINKPAAAITLFDQSLEAMPGRLLSIQGREKAVAMLNRAK